MNDKNLFKMNIKSLDDLEKLGLEILDTNEVVVSNKLSKILSEKKISPSELSNLTGINRQNISKIIQGTLPRIDYVLKIAAVLELKVEDIFTLTDNAWKRLLKISSDEGVYLDLHKLSIITSSAVRELSKDKTTLYYSMVDKKCLSEEEYEEAFNRFMTSGKNTDKTKGQLKKDFDKIYTKRYKKLVQKINI